MKAKRTIIYYGPRESWDYFARLNHLYLENNSPHHMVAVAGGGSFLWAINSYTKFLTVIDRYSVNLNYIKLIVSLIETSDNLQQFVAFLTQRVLTPNGTKLGQKTPMASTALQKLSPEIFDLWKQLIKPLRFDTHGVAKMNSRVIHLFAKDSSNKLPKNHFYIKIGAGPFLEERFAKLKQILNSTPKKFLCADLADMGSEELHDKCSDGMQTLYLLSNADAPEYTASHDLVSQFFSTASVPSTLVSWSRHINLPNNNHADALEKIQPLTENRSVLEIKNYNGYAFSRSEIRARGQTIIGFDAFKGIPSWGDVLLFHISLPPQLSDTQRRTKYLYLARRLAPTFRRVIFFDFLAHVTPQTLLEWLTEDKFHYSYTLTRLEWTGGNNSLSRSFIMCWDLRGQT